MIAPERCLQCDERNPFFLRIFFNSETIFSKILIIIPEFHPGAIFSALRYLYNIIIKCNYCSRNEQQLLPVHTIRNFFIELHRLFFKIDTMFGLKFYIIDKSVRTWNKITIVSLLSTRLPLTFPSLILDHPRDWSKRKELQKQIGLNILEN